MRPRFLLLLAIPALLLVLRHLSRRTPASARLQHAGRPRAGAGARGVRRQTEELAAQAGIHGHRRIHRAGGAQALQPPGRPRNPPRPRHAKTATTPKQLLAGHRPGITAPRYDGVEADDTAGTRPMPTPANPQGRQLMRAAAVGIGSNSTRMLAAEIGAGTDRAASRVCARIRGCFSGAGKRRADRGAHDARPPQRPQRSASSARAAKAARRLRLFATSAARDAKNGAEFC